MEIKICQILVWNLIDRMSAHLASWKAQLDLARHSHQVPEPGHIGPTWSKQDDFPAWVVHLARYHFAQNGYWWEASAAQAMESETGGTEESY